ncbi:FKBP-type peptidyl-prolyl cis-trans isomerase [Teredinibacter purpureus]|uniref:FKBP-type peptidyl-prolyl cis-trans isomerase n=1 Tax=Teredinibacter purpureus TaxID=2731756 RepID=UPI0005F890A7|nr:FKBP-type peptidyl-prolyl cis-trans isomerase [Teredinibacter purpureus]
MTSLIVGEGMQVTLFFSLTLDNGDVIDSNFDAKPATFVVGDGNLMPGFETSIFGLSVGAKASLTLPPEKAFGQPNPNNIQTVPRNSFTEEFELSVGLVVSFADAAGGEMPGVVAEIGEQEVKIDFNHPLSGKPITFDVEIVDVEPAITH